jgi:acid phosphatase family membrane protein YuiD
MRAALRDIWSVFVMIVTNRIFIATFFSWFVAQSLKILINLIKTGKIDFRMLVGTGGMPSSHTATVTALSMSVGLTTGFSSAVFMVSLGYCIVVCSDAMGVRRAAGKQARVLNMMMDEFGSSKFHAEKRLKELLGHSPIEAFMGILLGMIIPILFF